jgi:hypothetical protein
MDDSIDFYEDTLSIFKQKQVPDEMQAILGITSSKKKKKRNLNRNPDSVHAKMQLNQFRLVDYEEYVIGNIIA